MSALQVSFAIAVVGMLSTGQILFKYAADRIDVAGKGVFQGLLLNPYLLVALVVYGVATILWLFVLKNSPLRVAYPLVSLAFIIVPVLSHLILHEELKVTTFAGGALIMLGVWVCSR
ncbi:EamA family transporter [Cupriavidus necator]|uniref:EamA domain-containing protein n=1 Tax=Cupriavidus necator TaxID=106590 RepID=A0A367PIE4_CUPNE|nr:EamA family transporter [Cupriavidus necator]QQX83637.1 EamA family transporter [Cupriavidus necator]RCJ06766.1 hypothetical protein DDK22_20010 [Cupriavidus necator]